MAIIKAGIQDMLANKHAGEQTYGLKSKQINLYCNDRDPQMTPVMESVVQGGTYVGGFERTSVPPFRRCSSWG